MSATVTPEARVRAVVRGDDRVGHGRARDLGRCAVGLGDREIGLRRGRDGVVLDLAVVGETGERQAAGGGDAEARHQVSRFVVAVAGTAKDEVVGPRDERLTLTKIASPAVVAVAVDR